MDAAFYMRVCTSPLLFLVLLISSPSADASARRPMGIDDLFTIRSIDITDVAISPDGRQIAYVVSAASDQANDTARGVELQTLTVGGRQSRQIAKAASITNLAWSPDGRTLAYLVVDAAGRQLRLHEVARGATSTLQFTLDGRENPPFVYHFSWAPSGGRIAFLASFLSRPPVRADAAMPKVMVLGESRQLDMVPRTEGADTFVAVVDVNSGEATRMTAPSIVPAPYLQSINWSTDGARLLFTGRDEPLRPELFGTLAQREVFSIDVRAGGVERVGGTRGGDTYPLWSPRVDAVIFLGNDSQDDAAIATALRRLDLNTRQMSVLVDGVFNVTQTPPRLLPRRNEVLYTNLSSATQKLYSVSLRSGQVRAISPPNMHVLHYSIASDEDTIAAVLTNANDPPEVFIGSVRTGNFRKLTDVFAPERERFLFSQVERIQWPSNDGRFIIDGFLVKPPHFDRNRKYPLLVNIHGGPGADYVNVFRQIHLNSDTLAEFYANNGYLVLLPNHRGGVSNRANINEFGNALHGHYTASYDLDVDPGVDYLLRQGFVDENRIGVMGASYGGYAAAWAVTRTHRYKAASVNDSMFNMLGMYYGVWHPKYRDHALNYMGGSPQQVFQRYIDASPLYRVDRIRTPIMLRTGNEMNGVLRPYFFYVQALEFYVALRDQNVPAELIVHPYESHGVADPETNRDYLIRNADWFDFWLNGKEDPDPRKAAQYQRWRSMRDEWQAAQR